MDGSRDGRRWAAGSHEDAIDDMDQEFVSAPPFGDPACFLHVDVIPVRDVLDRAADAIRAASGLRPISAAAFRRRRANRHRRLATEFVQRRREGRDAGDDGLCRNVQAAMDKGVVGSCAYCGCNFSVVAVVDVKGPAGAGRVCGICLRPLRVHQPVPMVRPPGANVEERFKGWTPW